MAARWSEAELPRFRERRVNDPKRAIKLLAAEAADCTRCPLYKNATQTVFSEGPANAALMLVGEQPGDQEDLQGRPFIGPAGKVLDRALEEAGLDRGDIYITNAVKHFKNEPRGKRRLHKKPDTSEIDACRWWLDHELEIVQPEVAVALGATAARGMFRKALGINAQSRPPHRSAGWRPRRHQRASVLSAQTERAARLAARVRSSGQGFAFRSRRRIQSSPLELDCNLVDKIYQRS